MSEETSKEKLELAAMESLKAKQRKGLISTVGDFVTTPEVLEEILDNTPIGKLRKARDKIGDAYFFNRFSTFLEAVNELPVEQRREFVNNMSEKEIVRNGGYIVQYVEKLSDETKSKIAGRIYAKHIAGAISKDEMLRFHHIVNSLFVLDLVELMDAWKNRKPIPDDIASQLVPLGITTYHVDDRETREAIKHAQVWGGRRNRHVQPARLTYSLSEVGSKFFATICEEISP